ncbi:MAG: helix-turn-helix domain-containing protein [Pseudomonadota bacterium]
MALNLYLPKSEIHRPCSRRVQQVVAAVCFQMEVPSNGILAHNRSQHLVTPRFMSWRIIQDTSGWNASQIGRYFGGYARVSVLYGINEFNKRKAKDPALEAAYYAVLADLERQEMRANG